MALSRFTKECPVASEEEALSPAEVILTDAIVGLERLVAKGYTEKQIMKRYRRLVCIAKGLKLYPIPEEIVKARDMRARMGNKIGALCSERSMNNYYSGRQNAERYYLSYEPGERTYGSVPR